jgi:hypothetical protein
MLRVLAQSENLDYWDWLHLATGNRYADNQALESAWLSFLERRASFTMVPPFPAPELQLTCQPTAGANAALYRYEPVEGHLEKEIDLMQESVLMVPVPTRNGVVVGEQRASGSSTATRLLLWQSGTQTVLSHSTYDLLPVSFDAALAGNQLLVLNRRTRQYGLLSLENCQTAGNCSVDTFPGLPLWSPDGQKAISLVATGNFGYEDRFARPFLMGDITGDILATGKAPFWMDDKTVAFIEPLDQSIMGVTVDQDAARYEILSIAKLVSSVPDWEDSKQMRLEHAAVMVGEPNSLLIVSADAESIYFFRQALPTGEVTFEAEADIVLEPQILYHYGYSPDDHWLVISGSDLTEGTSSIHLYNLNSRETASYQFAAVYDFPLHWLLSWSTDGQWLSVPDNGHLRLISPEADYQKLIVLEDLMCSGAVWVDHESG